MEWNSIFSIVTGVTVIFGVFLAVHSRKKSGARRREQLCQHLQKIGVSAYAMQIGDIREGIGQKHSLGKKSMGILGLNDRNVDSINIIGISSQYGTNYFVDYLVKSANIIERRMLGKVKLIRKKNRPFWGKVTSVEWTGDKSLSQDLNFDYDLEGKLLTSEMKDPGRNIQIIPEPEYEYARIKTDYFLPSSEAFEAIDIIAKHIKSW
ncbi:MAG: hypothetical protein J7L19_05225 [Dehalococcoidia bacterium]|nr:hypothetical protein [Dehalococcoidia bacterium]